MISVIDIWISIFLYPAHSLFVSSMQKSLPLVKATISNIVESGSDVPKWVLTGFNDPSVTVVKETALSEELKSAADSLTFGGGGDAKEQALQGK